MNIEKEYQMKVKIVTEVVKEYRNYGIDAFTEELILEECLKQVSLLTQSPRKKYESYTSKYKREDKVYNLVMPRYKRVNNEDFPWGYSGPEGKFLFSMSPARVYFLDIELPGEEKYRMMWNKKPLKRQLEQDILLGLYKYKKPYLHSFFSMSAVIDGRWAYR